MTVVMGVQMMRMKDPKMGVLGVMLCKKESQAKVNEKSPDFD
jgi:hypothetical protein